MSRYQIIVRFLNLCWKEEERVHTGSYQNRNKHLRRHRPRLFNLIHHRFFLPLIQMLNDKRHEVVDLTKWRNVFRIRYEYLGLYPKTLWWPEQIDNEMGHNVDQNYHWWESKGNKNNKNLSRNYFSRPHVLQQKGYKWRTEGRSERERGLPQSESAVGKFLVRECFSSVSKIGRKPSKNLPTVSLTDKKNSSKFANQKSIK